MVKLAKVVGSRPGDSLCSAHPAAGLRAYPAITPDTGDVWIGSSDTWLIGFVPAVIQRLAQRHPNIVVHASDANASDFELRKFDLIIGRIERPRVDDDSNPDELRSAGLRAVTEVNRNTNARCEP